MESETGPAPLAPGAHPNVQRVHDALVAAGCAGEPKVLADSTRTSAEAAAALGAEVGQIAKSLVFLADERPVVVLMSGSCRVATSALASALGAKHVQKANADVVKAATGYPIGGVSPAGLPSGLEVVVDASLSGYDVIWAAAGTPNAVYPTTFRELVVLTGGQVVDVAEPAAE